MNLNGPLLYSIFLWLFVSVTSCSHRTSQNQENNVFTAQVTFNDSIHDFGTFSSDNPTQKYIFFFMNRSNVPAVILNVTPSCRCISTEYTREVVLPGKSGKVEVTFDGTKSAVGYFDKSVQIRMNSPHTYTLNIKGHME